MICQFASQYDFSSWSTYDQLFRARLVNNPVMSWDQIDEELYNRYIRGGTLQSKCFHCRNYGHYASTCPLRENMTRPSNATYSSQQQIPSSFPTTNQPFRAPQIPPPTANQFRHYQSMSLLQQSRTMP